MSKMVFISTMLALAAASAYDEFGTPKFQDKYVPLWKDEADLERLYKEVIEKRSALSKRERFIVIRAYCERHQP